MTESPILQAPSGPTRRSLPSSAVGVGLGAIAAKVVASWPRMGTDTPAVAIVLLTVLSFVVIGLTLLTTGLPRINGWACLVVAWATVPGDLNDPPYMESGLTWVGFMLEPGYLAAAVALVLRYPRSRLTRPERVLVWSLLTASIGSRIPTMLTTGRLPDGFHRPEGFPTLADSALWHDLVFVRGGRGLVALLLLVVGGMLVWRAGSAIGLTRQSLAPLALVTGICALAAAFDQAIWALAIPELRGVPAALVRDLSAAMIPVALLADLLRRRAAGAAIASTVLAAARSGDVVVLEHALRKALVDPSLTVGLPGAPILTAEGRSPSAHPRATTPVTTDSGEPLMTLTYDPRAIGDEGLLQTAIDSARVGLENTRLNAELRAGLAALQQANARIVEAGLEERRRVERNLHDGAQQQFLAVAALLARVDLVQPDQAKEIVGQARVQLKDALGELRRLAHGIHPSALAQGGLGPALLELRDSAPFRVTLSVDQAIATNRPRPAVETAAYFTAAEALANVAKHADASAVLVVVCVGEGNLIVEVTDNGQGGIQLRPGGGLAGLRDRLAALGGTLTVHSDPSPEFPARHGSRLEAAIPLAEAVAP